MEDPKQACHDHRVRTASDEELENSSSKVTEQGTAILSDVYVPLGAKD